MAKSFSLLLVCALALSGCSMFSRSGRQKHAYEKYVRRSSVTRQKRQMFFRSNKPQMPSAPAPSERSEPIENSEAGPQAVPAEG